MKSKVDRLTEEVKIDKRKKDPWIKPIQTWFQMQHMCLRLLITEKTVNLWSFKFGFPFSLHFSALHLRQMIKKGNDVISNHHFSICFSLKVFFSEKIMLNFPIKVKDHNGSSQASIARTHATNFIKDISRKDKNSHLHSMETCECLH